MYAAGQRLTLSPGSTFLLQERLGAGGMGEVWRALREGTISRTVALKFILPSLLYEAENASVVDEEIRRFRDEARLVAALPEIPSVVRVYDVHEYEDSVVQELSFVDGISLRQVLESIYNDRGATQPMWAVALGARLARALGKIHAATNPQDGVPLRIVHRDISPSNIMISEHNGPVLIDFGMAFSAMPNREAATQGPSLKGKSSYMAPEQARREQVTAASDQFALALVIFECVLGSPFYARGMAGSSEEIADFVARGVNQNFINSRLRDIEMSGGTPKADGSQTSAEALADVLRRALAMEPTMRWHNCTEFGQQLTAICGHDWESRMLRDCEDMAKTFRALPRRRSASQRIPAEALPGVAAALEERQRNLEALAERARAAAPPDEVVRANEERRRNLEALAARARELQEQATPTDNPNPVAVKKEKTLRAIYETASSSQGPSEEESEAASERAWAAVEASRASRARKAPSAVSSGPRAHVSVAQPAPSVASRGAPHVGKSEVVKMAPAFVPPAPAPTNVDHGPIDEMGSDLDEIGDGPTQEEMEEAERERYLPAKAQAPAPSSYGFMTPEEMKKVAPELANEFAELAGAPAAPASPSAESDVDEEGNRQPRKYPGKPPTPAGKTGSRPPGAKAGSRNGAGDGGGFVGGGLESQTPADWVVRPRPSEIAPATVAAPAPAPLAGPPLDDVPVAAMPSGEGGGVTIARVGEKKEPSKEVRRAAATSKTIAEASSGKHFKWFSTIAKVMLGVCLAVFIAYKVFTAKDRMAAKPPPPKEVLTQAQEQAKYESQMPYDRPAVALAQAHPGNGFGGPQQAPTPAPQPAPPPPPVAPAKFTKSAAKTAPAPAPAAPAPVRRRSLNSSISVEGDDQETTATLRGKRLRAATVDIIDPEAQMQVLLSTREALDIAGNTFGQRSTVYCVSRPGGERLHLVCDTIESGGARVKIKADAIGSDNRMGLVVRRTSGGDESSPGSEGARRVGQITATTLAGGIAAAVPGVGGPIAGAVTRELVNAPIEASRRNGSGSQRAPARPIPAGTSLSLQFQE